MAVAMLVLCTAALHRAISESRAQIWHKCVLWRYAFAAASYSTTVHALYPSYFKVVLFSKTRPLPITAADQLAHEVTTMFSIMPCREVMSDPCVAKTMSSHDGDLTMV